MNDLSSDDSDGLLAATRYSFTCKATPGVVWHVRRFDLVESLSEPYRLHLEILTDDVTVDPGVLLGAECDFFIERDVAARAVYGVVARMRELGVVTDRLALAVDLVPAFAMLGQVVNTRFFQEQSVPDILQQVLEPGLELEGRRLRLDLDAAAYEPREYCVQFRESDLEFAARLMQEEGILYYFEHPVNGGPEVLVLAGESDRCPPLPLEGDRENVEYLARQTGTALRQAVDSFTPTWSLRTTSIVQRDFDWQHPSDSPYQRERRSKDLRGRDREVFDHDELRLHRDDGSKRAKRKLEQQAAQTRVYLGTGDVTELTPGYTFTLLGHPQHQLDRDYLLVRVRHRGAAPEEDMYANNRGESRYDNEFEAIPADVPWRPEPTLARPRAHGPQTAIVVGPQGEEVHTDEHGRIKVHFHWDRISPFDDTASCWIRVAQKWAGPSWGAVFIPRVGMEVIVEFLDGDPDRPVVTGCVYNGQNRPPYDLPLEKTKSTIKSETSPGGGGSNEIRFEDAAGAEEIFIHGQQDMNTDVIRDTSRKSGRDDTSSIGRHQTDDVGVDRKSNVGNNETLSVGVDQSLTVGNNQTISVGTSQSLSVGVNQNETVGANQTISVGANQSTTVGGSMTLTVSGAMSVSGGGSASTTVGGSSTTTIGGTNTTSVGGSSTTNVGAAASVTISAAHDLNIGAARTTNIGGTDTLNVAGTVTINAASITLSAGGSTIEVGPGGIKITAGAIVSITGAMVNVNT
ncbi:type VI secretion system tip protein TssI/VgrG [Nannocystis sp. SCPEA4]|uniref:type VI secretion system Vgr family protein n=1 Tax=Nannocystis sp. SCPEA4 TaxID=2996787 RepID=UPI00226F4BDF|nr:type VI secretion system tip protein TssI/VgrG [Nannocystis sp. SCPEA4]MCY1060958.1 type VI secretion system tip protein TssI/VgrG [Nannocystis sp. SCPEA4]